MSHRYPPLLLVFALVFAMSYGNPIAAQLDSGEPINVKADSAKISDTTGISTYMGNVEITQGDTLLTGEKVVVEAIGQKVRKITSEGHPGTFRQTREDGEVVYAEAENMVYEVNVNKITLTNNARLTEADNTLSGDRIVFYTDTETISAESSGGNNRVNITIFPKTSEEGGN